MNEMQRTQKFQSKLPNKQRNSNSGTRNAIFASFGLGSRIYNW